ncbi:MAG: hypothetical protein OEZ14_01590 [Acidimicrobiia bacterium]|nr:hypothetical protein [Acidimicrobiia bacterium]
MNQLEERLRTAGRSRTDIAPDIGSIRNRGLKIRRNRQITTSVAAVALVAMGGVAALNAFRPESDTTIVSASDGQADGDGIDTTVPDPDGEPTGDATTPGTSDDELDAVDDPNDGAAGEADAVDVAPGESDGSAEGDGSGTQPAPLPPSPNSVADGSDGWLTVTPSGIEHQRADGSTGLIRFADPPAGFAQRWPTDVVTIEGRQYLLVDQFVNRDDLETERVKALAESYGIPYDAETGAFGLEGVATPEELDSLNHWEVSILAVDLDTDEISVVESRVINSVHSADWVYNGHITSDGSNILVMRELWQGYCLYAEGLTLDGQPVAIADAVTYPKPQGIDSMSYDEIDAVFSGRVEPPQPCRTLDEVPESGLEVWGTQADNGQIEAFRSAFFEAGLG